MLTQEKKQEIIKEHAVHEGDTGSPEVQIAVLTARIQYLTEHLKEHKKRSSFTSRTFEDGWTSPPSSELSVSNGY